MKNQITKYQHYVPQHYLRLWKQSDGSVWWHNLATNDNKPRSTKKILGEDYLYEDSSANPDNKVEDYLSEIENLSAPILRKISELQPEIGTSVDQTEEAMCIQAGLILSVPEAKEKILNFISAQLVRTLRTLEKIDKSIEESDLPEETISTLRRMNRPPELVKLGMERLPRRLAEGYTIVLSYAVNKPLLTSDHPVAEVNSSPNEIPQTAYNVLHKNDTFLSFSLCPSFHCFLIPNSSSDPFIKRFRDLLDPWPRGVEINSAIRWRILTPELLNALRTLQTGFGRKIVISCKDETNFLKTHQVKKLAQN